MATSFDSMNAAQLTAWGEEMTFTPAVGDPETITGIDMSAAMSEASTPGNVAHVWVQVSDFTTYPSRGDGWIIGSDGFVIERVDNDGGGGAVILLRKTA